MPYEIGILGRGQMTGLVELRAQAGARGGQALFWGEPGSWHTEGWPFLKQSRVTVGRREGNAEQAETTHPLPHSCQVSSVASGELSQFSCLKDSLGHF